MLEDKIILRSVYKITRCFMEPAVNPATGRFPDVVRRVNSNGDVILSENDLNSGNHFIAETDIIEIYDGKEFDLEDPHQKSWWEAIRYSKKIAQDRKQKDEKGNLVIDGNTKRYGTAEFYVERPGVETANKNRKGRAIHDAKAHIYSDSPDRLYQKARLLGNPMHGLPVSDVEDYLVSLAERKPELVIEVYTGSDTHLRLFLLDAMDKHVIYYKDKIYHYGTIVLGATETAVLNYIKNPDNKRITELIKREVYSEYEADDSQAQEDVTVDTKPAVKSTRVK